MACGSSRSFRACSRRPRVLHSQCFDQARHGFELVIRAVEGDQAAFSHDGIAKNYQGHQQHEETGRATAGTLASRDDTRCDRAEPI